jgi:F420H(2)-dependent quinone reductase
MPPLTQLFTRFSVQLYRLSGGMIGGRLGSASVLLLTTAGRKTGKLRTTPLRYLRQGDDYMIAASN